jgi:hypothetical protein
MASQSARTKAANPRPHRSVRPDGAGNDAGCSVERTAAVVLGFVLLILAIVL